MEVHGGAPSMRTVIAEQPAARHDGLHGQLEALPALPAAAGGWRASSSSGGGRGAERGLFGCARQPLLNR